MATYHSSIGVQIVAMMLDSRTSTLHQGPSPRNLGSKIPIHGPYFGLKIGVVSQTRRSILLGGDQRDLEGQ